MLKAKKIIEYILGYLILKLWHYPIFNLFFIHFIFNINYYNFFYLLMCSFITYFLFYYYLDRGNLIQKKNVVSYIEKYNQCYFKKIPYKNIISFYSERYLPPFGYLPKDLKQFGMYLFVNVVQVIPDYSQGKVLKPGALNAYPSPSGHEMYVFITDDLENMTAPQKYFLLHEISHGADMTNAALRRATIKFYPVFIGLVWLLFHIEISTISLALYLMTLLLSLYINKYELYKLRLKVNYYAEISADYLACIHMNKELAIRLKGKTKRIIPYDKDLTEEEHKERLIAFDNMLDTVINYGASQIKTPKEYLQAITFPGYIYLLFFSLFISLPLFFLQVDNLSIAASIIILLIYAFLYLRNFSTDKAYRRKIEKNFK